MAIVVQIDVPGITLERYDEAIEVAGFLPGGPLPAGGLFHWVAKTAADLGNSPLSITEIPQLIAGVGCR